MSIKSHLAEYLRRLRNRTMRQTESQTGTRPATGPVRWVGLEGLEARLLLDLGTVYIVKELSFDIAVDSVLTFGEAFAAANENVPVGDAPAGKPDSLNFTDWITFDETLAGQTLTLGTLDLKIIDALEIQGGGTIFDANDLSRIFWIDGETKPTVRISDLTMQNGAAGELVGAPEGYDVYDYNGGAIINFGSLELVNCKILTSKASRPGEGIARGGGIFSAGEYLLVDHCMVMDNLAWAGPQPLGGDPGLSGGAGLAIEANLELTGVVAEADIINSVFMGNGVNLDPFLNPTQGGGLGVFEGANVGIVNTTLVYNFAMSSGGGIYIDADSTVGMHNSLLSSNDAGWGDSGPDALGTFATADRNWIETENGYAMPPGSIVYHGWPEMWDWRLRRTSGPVDKGVTSYAKYPDGTPIAVDIEDQIRIDDDFIDIGADEYYTQEPESAQAALEDKVLFVEGESSAENITAGAMGVDSVVIELYCEETFDPTTSVAIQTIDQATGEWVDYLGSPSTTTVDLGDGYWQLTIDLDYWDDPAHLAVNSWFRITIAGDEHTNLFEDMNLYIGNLIGDLNGDGFVNATDFAIFAGNYGMTEAEIADGDLNNDDLINAADLAIMAANFGNFLVPNPLVI